MEEVLNELREIKKLLHAVDHRAEQQEALRRQGLRILLVFLAFQHPDFSELLDPYLERLYGQIFSPDFLEILSSDAADIDTLIDKLYGALRRTKEGGFSDGK